MSYCLARSCPVGSVITSLSPDEGVAMKYSSSGKTHIMYFHLSVPMHETRGKTQDMVFFHKMDRYKLNIRSVCWRALHAL